MVLSVAVKKEIDHWVAKFPEGHKQSAVLQALRLAQEDQADGCLTPALMDAVADYLEIPSVAVYEVASFYTMYHHEPVGKYVIHVCVSISCMLCASRPLIAHLQKRLGIKVGDTTADKKFTLKTVGCLGACVGAPAVQINKTYYEKVTPASIDAILDSLE